MEFVYFIWPELYHHRSQAALTWGKKIHISMSEVGRRSFVPSYLTHIRNFLHTSWNRTRYVLILTRYLKKHVSLVRIKTLHTAFYSKFHALFDYYHHEISSLTQVYYVIPITITMQTKRQIIRCITLWAMGSRGCSILGEMQPTHEAN
jgi:hypothetical protein